MVSSHLVKMVQKSGTLETLEHAQELENKGIKVIYLSIGNPDFDTALVQRRLILKLVLLCVQSQRELLWKLYLNLGRKNKGTISYKVFTKLKKGTGKACGKYSRWTT